mgnify:FL=1
MAEAHIDQSHCNYHLREALKSKGWELLFRDSPSHSRGGDGTQGQVLRIVEQNGWPIPDLVLVRLGVLLIVEIDGTFSAAQGSFERYGQLDEELRAAFGNVAGQSVGTVLYGFCKCSKTLSPETYFQREDGWPVDVVIAFSHPGAPIFSRPLD